MEDLNLPVRGPSPGDGRGRTGLRVLALSGFGAAFSLLGLLRETDGEPFLSYGGALLVCAAFYFLVAWLWHLRLDGVAFLNTGEKSGSEDSEKSAAMKKEESRRIREISLAGLAILALSLLFQYLVPRFI